MDSGGRWHVTDAVWGSQIRNQGEWINRYLSLSCLSHASYENLFLPCVPQDFFLDVQAALNVNATGWMSWAL